VKIWPEFNDAGDLPPGIHSAKLEELISHFGVGIPQRVRVANRLRQIYERAIASGHLGRFIVFGSFITAKTAPNDVDIFILMEDSFDVNQVAREVRLIFDHAAAQNYLGASIFWLRHAAALGGESNAISHWQTKRDGGRRGIVEVTRGD